MCTHQTRCTPLSLSLPHSDPFFTVASSVDERIEKRMRKKSDEGDEKRSDGR